MEESVENVGRRGVDPKQRLNTIPEYKRRQYPMLGREKNPIIINSQSLYMSARANDIVELAQVIASISPLDINQHLIERLSKKLEEKIEEYERIIR